MDEDETPQETLKSVAVLVWRGLKVSMYLAYKHVIEVLEEIGETTGILSVKLIANRLLHWIERLLWLILILLSIYGAYLMSSTQLQRYILSPTVVSLDRDYRGWKGMMPAITICYNEQLDIHKSNKYIKTKWNVSLIDEDYVYLMEFLYAVVNATANNFEELVRFSNDARFEDIDLSEVVNAIVRPFSQELTSFVAWHKLTIYPVITERGLCYAVNSPISALMADKTAKSRDIDEFEEPLYCEFGKQACFIKFELFEGAGLIDVHSPYEISVSDASVISIDRSEEVTISYKFSETVASEKLRELTPSQRKCVFRDEKVYPLPMYAKSLCLARCRATMALEMCNCIPFFYPYVDGPNCNPAGFDCLMDFKWPVWALHICNCPATCTETEYTIQAMKRISLKETGTGGEDDLSSTFLWDVNPPKVRMQRDVVFSFEDLVVSFGGTLALFLGFSVVSIVHIINVLCYDLINLVWTALYYSFKIMEKLALRTVRRKNAPV